MAELRIRRQALTFAVFEAELDAEQRQAIGSRKTREDGVPTRAELAMHRRRFGSAILAAAAGRPD
jgi:hypothetical protein